MNFLNVGPWELTVILIIAILLVGPRRVVEIVQTVRRFAGQLRSMSSEFTSLIQTEVQTIKSETSQALADATGDEPAPATGSEEEPQELADGRETGGKLGEIIKEGLAPIADIQAELRATAQETRQALERVVKDELGPIADIQAQLQDAAQKTRQALEKPIQDETGAIAGIQAELQDAAQETRQAIESIAASEPKPKEEQDEAPDRETTN